jgi:hypothetical protein
MCSNVIDVSALGHVHKLNLRRYNNVLDVSVHMLYLSGCDNIRDLSALGHVHMLYLSD